VDHIINRVRKKDIPRITWFGGTCCRERARLIKSRTMDIRKKLVIRIIILGARERTVMRRRSWREKATSSPESGFRMVRSIKGITGSAGGSGMAMVPWVEKSGKGRVWADTARPGKNNRKKKKTPTGTPKFFMD
jgi:hypothetical protein